MELGYQTAGWLKMFLELCRKKRMNLLSATIIPYILRKRAHRAILTREIALNAGYCPKIAWFIRSTTPRVCDSVPRGSFGLLTLWKDAHPPMTIPGQRREGICRRLVRLSQNSRFSIFNGA